MDEIEVSGVSSAAATDVLVLDATVVFSAETTDVFSAAKAASDGSCPAIRPLFKRRRGPGPMGPSLGEEGLWAKGPCALGPWALPRFLLFGLSGPRALYLAYGLASPRFFFLFFFLSGPM